MLDTQITSRGTIVINLKRLIEIYGTILDLTDIIQKEEFIIEATENENEYHFEHKTDSNDDYISILSCFRPYLTALYTEIIDLESLIVEKVHKLEHGQVITYEVDEVTHYYEDGEYGVFRDLLISNKEKWEFDGIKMGSEKQFAHFKDAFIHLFENTTSSRAIQNNLKHFLHEQFGYEANENQTIFSFEFSWNELDDTARNEVSVYLKDNKFVFFINYTQVQLVKTTLIDPFTDCLLLSKNQYELEQKYLLKLSLFSSNNQIVSLPKTVCESLFKWLDKEVEYLLDDSWKHPCYHCEKQIEKIINGCSNCIFFQESNLPVPSYVI